MRRSIEEIAEELICIVPERGDELDFSEASLQVVEDLLAWASANRDSITESDRRRIVEGFGSYVLEVARRMFGGRYVWNDASEQPVLIVGEPEAEIALAAWRKVEGRFMGDEGDNVPFHFEGFAARARAMKTGDRVWFV